MQYTPTRAYWLIRKIRITAEPVKVTGDATIIFPLIVSQTFAKDVESWGEAVAATVCWIDDLTDELAASP
jgi:hypothetical protein